MGCGGEDSVKHYAHCAVYHALSRKHLGLGRPELGLEIAEFIGLELGASMYNGSLSNVEVMALRAASVYAASRVHGAVRHGLSPTSGADAFAGYLREAYRCHARLAGLVQRAHKRVHQQ